MSTISLILADKDDFFSERFSRYILEHNSIFDIIAFTKCEYLMEYLGNNSADILLIDKDFINDEVKAYLKNSLVIVLDDADNDYDGEYCHISKYQKTEDIIKKITFKYAESIGDKSIISANSTGAAKLVSVYSPIGGSGKTTIALGLAASMTARGQRVVYFNMEKFNSTGAYLSTDGQEGLSEIFLKLKNKNAMGKNASNAQVSFQSNDGEESKIESFSFAIMKRLLTDSSGLLYFAPPESAMEFNEMTTEEIITLLEEIANIADLDYVIIDLPTEFNESVIDVLKLSESVVFVTAGDTVGVHKTAMFMNEVNIFADLRIVYEKFLPVINKSDTRGISQGLQEILGEKGAIASVPIVSSLSRCRSVADMVGVLGGYLVNVVDMIVGR
jgi:cellulose biosynthesis protein BcsQ